MRVMSVEEEKMVTRPIERHLSFTKKAFAEGKAKGKADSVLMILDARGIAVSDAVRERIRACTDMETLDRWIRQAAVIADADELFT